VREVGAGAAPGAPVEVWFGDEMRVGRKGTLTRVWAATGSRPRAPRSDGYQSVYLFGAVCPSRDLGCALILPRCDTAAMALCLAELSGHVAPGAHAVLVLDGAGWHAARDLPWPANLTPLSLPPYSPELNPRERAREFLRQHYLALCRFLDHTALLDACQHAWRRFTGEPGRIRSLCSSPWAIVP
jgi:DDE superfamily endonuclease